MDFKNLKFNHLKIFIKKNSFRSALSSILIPYCLIFSATIYAEENDNITTSSVPPGFAALLKPQTTAIDIFFGGEYLTTTLARFNPNFVELLVPEEITAQLTLLKEKQIFFKQISAPLSPNSGLLCSRPNQKDCGMLKPDVAGIIFNEAAYRADLFINPLLLLPMDEQSQKFLNPSNIPHSYVNNLNLTASGDDLTEDHYNLTGHTILAHKQDRIQTLWDYNDTEHTEIESISWQRDKLGMEYEAGLFATQSKSINFTPNNDITGIRVATSLKTRTDLVTSKGSEIVTFFNSRSRVEIYRRDKLIDVQFYDVGNHVIDTRFFPEGAYNIKLVIKDVTGNETVESHFFAKTPRLPPIDAPQYGMELGRISVTQPDEVLPQLSESWIMRSSFSQRIKPDLGIEGSALFISGQSHLEAGVLKLGPSYQIATGVLGSTNKDYGVSIDGRYQYKDYATSFGIRRIYAEQPLDTSAPASPYYDPIIASTTVINASLSFQTYIGAFNTQFTRRRAANTNAGETYSLRYQKSLATFLDSNISLNAEAGKTKDVDNDLDADIELPVDKEFYSIGVRASFNSKHWSTSLNSSYKEDLDLNVAGTGASKKLRGEEYSFRTGWKDADILSGDLETSIYAKKQLDAETLGTELRYDSHLGRSKFMLQDIKAPTRETQQWAASLGFGIIGNKDSIAIGGHRQGLSATIIEIEGDAEDAYFDAYVNGNNRGPVAIGRRNVLNLAPYKNYNVFLRPKGESFINFTNENKRVTLFPGNVTNFKWSAQEVIVIFGRITDQDGNIVPNARITGLLGLATSDSDGIFQAEIESDTTELVFETLTQNCSVVLPDYIVNEGIAFVGDLECILINNL